jgi:hypothetical protein
MDAVRLGMQDAGCPEKIASKISRLLLSNDSIISLFVIENNLFVPRMRFC